MCANRVQTLRSSAPGVLPQAGTRQPGELWLNFADNALGFIDSTQTAQKLLATRLFVTTTSYAVGDFVVQGGNLYCAIAPSSAGAFVATNWSKVGTAQDLALYLPLAGGTLTGPLILSGPPTQPLQAATKAYVDSGAFLPLSGGTMTGPLVLNADPTIPLGAATKQYIDAKPVAMNDNRIINGDMRIDQRNNGASISAANGYTIDRWAYVTSSGIVSAGQSQTAPSGFGYSLWSQATAAHISAAGDAYFFYQKIEADQATDFAWGTPQAQPVTLSFWAASSLTGTFSGSIGNGAAGTRCYPFTFSLPTANTFTKIVINIPADTSGAWTLTGNGAAVQISFDLGCGSTYRAPANTWVSGNYLAATGAVSLVGTNGASFYLTGVKLEVGSVATPFNRQSLAKSLADCQRYFEQGIATQGFYGLVGTFSYMTTYFAVPKRASPTITYSNPAFGNATAIALNGAMQNCFTSNITVTTANNTWVTATFQANAEL